jgi:glucokinase
MSAVVSVDVGGTSMKGGLVGRDGSVLTAEDRPTGRERGPDAVVASILDFAADLAARAGTPVAGAGVVVPGAVDERRGTAVYSANIGWRDVPLRDLVARRLGPGMPVAVGHDVRAGGLAESVAGAGAGVGGAGPGPSVGGAGAGAGVGGTDGEGDGGADGPGDLLFLPIGTGIAAAMVIRGEPYAGVSGWGGEIGHLVVRPGGEPCACGNRGCLETYASAASIGRRYRAPAGSPGDSEQVTAEDVVARMAGGDPRAVRVWGEAVEALADALAAYTMLLDPALIVIGGGLAASGEALLGPLRESLAARLVIRPAPPLAIGVLGVRAGMIGAGLLAWRAVRGAA